MTMTIRPASTIMLIGLQETNTIGYYAQSDCLEGLGRFGAGLPCLLPLSFASLAGSPVFTRKMFQTCGSATLYESESTINAREGSDDYPSAALPLLPRD